MIYILLKGRIGNVLFEIAAAASLAKRMQVPLRAVIASNELLPEPDNCTLKQYLHAFESNILRYIEFVDAVPAGVPLFQESAFSYNPLPTKADLQLSGYFQSEKYCDKTLIRELFAIDEGMRDYILKKYGHLFKMRNTVSVGVRRGDYVRQNRFHRVCPISYYQKAMTYLGKDNLFLIISDDVPWCRQHFKGDNLFFIENENPLVDFYLHSLCAHNIISNSSFIWWGAWLNPNPNKKVVYPSVWFGPLFYKKDTSDLCPPEWIALSNVHSFFFICQKIGLSAFLLNMEAQFIGGLKTALKRVATKIGWKVGSYRVS